MPRYTHPESALVAEVGFRWIHVKRRAYSLPD